MKTKKIIAIIAMALTCTTGFAQKPCKLTVQPKVGINVATMTDNEDYSSRIGFTAGAELEYMTQAKLSFTFGALYSQQGIKQDESGFEGTIKMDYINVPLLVNYYVTKGLAIKAGLQPGFLVNDKVKVEKGGSSVEVGLKETFESAGFDNVSIPSVVLSVPVGISYEFSDIVLDARYNIGVTNAIKADYGMESSSSKHNFFSFTIGYKFGL